MLQPAAHPREAERLATLERCEVLDTLEEAEFDSLTAIAAAITGCPIALVSLVDGERQWFKSRHGVSATETPRAISFCGHAILEPDAPFIVTDATRDPRFSDNPFVQGELSLRHYTGIPLRVGVDALPIGTLCVIDDRARTLTAEQLDMLRKLALHVERLLELRIRDAERITAARHDEMERRRAEQELQRFFDVALEPMLVFSRDRKVQRFNPALTTVLGWSREELLAQPFIDLVHSEDRAHVVAEVARLAEGSVTAAFEARYLRKDGAYTILSWRVVGALDIGSIIAVARDVTAERAQEHDLRRAMQAAESAAHAKSEFLATMSHEIRTPMNGVLGLTELLLGTKLDDEQRGMLGSVRDSGQALLQVLNDILDWSRIEAGRMQLESRAVDPARVLRDVVTVLRSQAASKGLTVDIEATADATHALGDPGRIRQILFNLIGNAVKFTDRGRIGVRLSLEPPSPKFPNGSCRFAVQDSGIGIAPDALARLFERFSQVDASATRRSRGSGLGLAISRQLADAMGGDIEVESCLGKGSTFTLVMPCATVEQAASEPKALAPPAGTSSRLLRVLVAEDDPINQKVARGLVTREGHHVTIAENGRLAIEAFDQAPFDLILMDVQMPEVSGLEATRRIRAIERERGAGHVVIVALTASVLPEEVGACLASGMDEVLAKPFAKAVLANVIHRAAERKSGAEPARYHHG